MRHPAVALSALVATAALPLALSAQGQTGTIAPYGFAPAGTGGFAPRAFLTGHPSPGATITLTLDQARGTALAGLFVSVKALDVPFLDTRLFLDPSPSSALGPFILLTNGTAGKGGVGQASVQTKVPAGLIGNEFYVQWLVNDVAATSGFVGTNGLRVTVSPGPLVVAGGSAIAEYVPGATSTTAGAAVKNINDIHFNNLGTRTYATSSTAFFIHDLTTTPRKQLASWAVGTGASLNCLAVHPDQRRAYVVSPSSTKPAIYILDIDEGSKTFGKSLGTVKSLPTTGLADMEGTSLSGDGKTLAVAVMGLLGTKKILIVDVDPASTKRDTLIKQVAIPAAVLGYMPDVAISRDGATAYCSVFNFGTTADTIIMVNVATGTVLKTAACGLFPADIDLDPLGRYLIAACSNSSLLTHVDLTPGTNFFKATNLPKTTARFFSVALTPDGSKAIAVGNGSVGDIHAFDMTTLKSSWSVKSTVSGASIAVR